MVEFSRDGCTSRDPYICYQSVRHFMKDAGMCTLKFVILTILMCVCVCLSGKNKLLTFAYTSCLWCILFIYDKC